MHFQRIQQDRLPICESVLRAAANEETMEEKISRILNWSITNPKFDPSFVQDLQDKLDDGRCLTEGQEIAVENIIRRFGIKTPNRQ